MKEKLIRLLGGIPKEKGWKACGKCLRFFVEGKTVHVIQAMHLYSDDITVEHRYFCKEHAPEFDIALNFLANDGTPFEHTILLKRTFGENQRPKLKVVAPPK